VASSEPHVDVLIVGSGPMGLGAAWRLDGLETAGWLLIEASIGPAGLADSVHDDQCFTWDLGGHVAHRGRSLY
jgi:protoporphyrinogen oxidase